MEEKITIESTLKSSDTEEWWDIVFTRPIGFRLALMYRNMKVSPNQVTLISIIFGIMAGICFYSANLKTNLIGMVLLVIANLHDSADGQLARMTNNKTKLGRILDGLAGDLWFVTIYCSISLRVTDHGHPWIWALAAGAGACHIIQAAMADYYRNIHLLFIKGEAGSEVDNSTELENEYNSIRWRNGFFRKMMLRFYLNYTKEQEFCSRNLQKLLRLIRERFGKEMPEWLTSEFRRKDRRLMKYTNILTFNTRMFALFFCLLIDLPWIYFLFEITVMNGILIHLVSSQEKISKYFVNKIECQR